MDQKKALLSIDVDTSTLSKNAADAKQKVADLTAQLKALKGTSQENSVEAVNLAAQLKTARSEYNSGTTQLSQYEKALDSNTGALDRMKINLSLLQKQFGSLTEEEQKNEAIGGAIQKQSTDLANQIKVLDTSVGSTKSSIGDYTNSITDALGAMGPFGGSLSQVVQSYKTLNDIGEKAAAFVRDYAKASEDAAKASAAAAEAIKATATATELSTAATEAQTVADKAAEIAKIEYEAALVATASEEAALLATKEVSLAATEANTVATEAAAAAQAANIVATAAQAEAATVNTAATIGETEATEGFTAALLANPLGLFIILVLAVVAAIGTLGAYFADFAPIADTFKGVFSGIKAVFDVVLNGIVQFVGGLNDLGSTFSKIGEFLTDPIGSFDKLATSMAAAAKEAYNLKEAELQLQRQLSAQDVINAAAQQQIAALRLLSRNRQTDASEREAYLKKATALEEDNYNQNKKLLDSQLDIAIRTAANKKQLNADEVKDLQQKGIVEAELLLQSGRIGQDQFDAIKKADLALTAILQQRTQIDEKNQNQADQIADRAEKKKEEADKKAEEARQKHEQKLNEIQSKEIKARDELAESAEKTRLDAIANDRQRELATIQADYAKKIDETRRNEYTQIQIAKERDAGLQAQMIKANGEIKAVILQLQKERNEEVAKQNVKYALDDAKIAHDLEDAKIQDQIESAGTDYQLIHDLKDKQNKEDLTFELSNIQLSETAKQKLRADFDKKQLQNDKELKASLLKRQEDDFKVREKLLEDEEKAYQNLKDAELKIQAEKLSNYKNASGQLADIFGKNTIAHKVAFLAQKAFAEAEIFINTQKQVSAINLAWNTRAAEDALDPFVGEALMIQDYAMADALTTQAIIQGVLEAAAVATTAVQGFSTGGLYSSDGKGGFLKGPGSGTSDSINARLSNGESIINAKSTQMFGPVLSAINEAGGGRAFAMGDHHDHFAGGGLFNATPDLGDGTDHVMHNILNGIYDRLSKMPKQILVVEDVQAGLQNKAMLKSKSNF